MNEIAELARAACATICDKSDWLTELDQAIGDGDHGINMRRGFEAMAAKRDELGAKPWGQALSDAGMVLVSTVGGASGPLYGTLLMAWGKAVKSGATLEEQMEQAVEGVKRRGKSDVGAKTMLDVLVPVLAALKGSVDKTSAERIAIVRQAADDALETTRPMQATRGRASFLGERSIGHLDPGAASTNLLIHTVCDLLAVDS